MLLSLVVADESIPIDLRLSAAKTLATILTPKMLEFSGLPETPESQGGGIAAAVARSPELRALLEAFVLHQAAEGQKLVEANITQVYVRRQSPGEEP